MAHRGTWLTAATGVVAVAAGLLVLRSPAAQASFGWFSYDPPLPEVLDSLVAWNLVRTVGAVLVLLGLVLLARSLGVLAAVRGGSELTRIASRVLVLGTLLVLGGLVAFVALGTDQRGEATVSISKVTGPLRPVTGPGVWTQDQLAAALVVATGLVVVAVGTGLRARRAVPADAPPGR